jgi:hypothetical protein
MSDQVVDALIVDLLLYLSSGERTYEDVMSAWRTSCPKLPVWEEANDRGLIAIEPVQARQLIRVSAVGQAFINEHAAKRAEPKHSARVPEQPSH